MECTGILIFEVDRSDAVCELGPGCPASALLPDREAYLATHDESRAKARWLVDEDYEG